MMTTTKLFYAYINMHWNANPHTPTYWKLLGAFQFRVQAAKALICALSLRYPGQWEFNGNQYVRNGAGAGDSVIGIVSPHDHLARAKADIVKAIENRNDEELRMFAEILLKYIPGFNDEDGQS